MNWIQVDGVGINAENIRGMAAKKALDTLADISPFTDKKDREDWAKKALAIIKPEKPAPGSK